MRVATIATVSGIDLSILVCGVHTRYATFLPQIQGQLFGQYEALPDVDKDRVEIVVLTDNKKMMLGEKRNLMVDMAQGRYTVFVDDDDRVADDYVASLLEATSSDADIITFLAEVSMNGDEPKVCDYSKQHGRDRNLADRYLRVPNHICCVKRDVGLKASFPSIAYGEDAGYAKLLLPNLASEHRIERVLYFYDYDAATTETQQQKAPRTRGRRRKASPLVDVVILSKASTRQLRKMTQTAVDTCIAGANSLPVNVIVVEGQGGIEYAGATTFHRADKFHFNRFANQAIRRYTADWVMVANNDLEFTNGWLHTLLGAGADVVSPRSPRDRRQADIAENESGWTNGRHFSGWCFMMRRNVWQQIGGLSEDVSFWCSDDVVVDQLQAAGIEPMIVADSIVHHLTSKTLSTVKGAARDDLTWTQVHAYNDRTGRTLFADRPEYAKTKPSATAIAKDIAKATVRVAVVAHPARIERARKLAAALGGYVSCDTESRGAEWNHLQVLEAHKDHDGHLIVLEDDAVPAEDFLDQAQAWIARFPDDLLSFYLGTGKPASWQVRIQGKLNLADKAGRDRVKLGQLLHGVCYALPCAKIAPLLARPFKPQFAIDMKIGDAWVSVMRRNVIYTLPSLVDHLDEGSLIAVKPQRSPRRAWRPPPLKMQL